MSVGSGYGPIDGFFESWNLCVPGVIYGENCVYYVMKHGDALDVDVDLIGVRDGGPYMAGVSIAQCLVFVRKLLHLVEL